MNNGLLIFGGAHGAPTATFSQLVKILWSDFYLSEQLSKEPGSQRLMLRDGESVLVARLGHHYVGAFLPTDGPACTLELPHRFSPGAEFEDHLDHNLIGFLSVK